MAKAIAQSVSSRTQKLLEMSRTFFGRLSPSITINDQGRPEITWIEQQGKDLSELDAQWYDFPGYWEKIHRKAIEIDWFIESFNERTGLLEK